MAGSHDEEDAGFWPGYVAAVSGLVQGLLIMAMALGISIFALSSIATNKGADETLAPAIDASANLGKLEPAPPGSPLPLAEPVPVAEPLKPIRVSFMGDAAITPPSAAQAIETAIQGRQVLGASRWRVETAADLADPRLRRAGYLRVIGLRGVLMNAGVPGDQIELSLRDDASAGDVDGSGMVIVSVFSDGATRATAPQEAAQ